MKLNPSTGNMYSFVTNTANAIKGVCPHNCAYCYCKRWGAQHQLHLDEKALTIPMPSDLFIFVGSACDMFADTIPAKWIDKVLKHCSEYQNRYLFQSKNPARFNWLFEYPLNCVACTTIETNRTYPEMGNAPSPNIRAEAMSKLDLSRYVTIEPIMDFDLKGLVGLIKSCAPIQVNIGADSGHNNLPEPPPEKVRALIAELKTFTIVAPKKNLGRILEFA